MIASLRQIRRPVRPGAQRPAVRACAPALLILALALLAPPAFAQAPGPAAHHLMPVPASVEWRPGRLAVTPAFRIAVTGRGDARLPAAVDRARRRLEGRLGFELPRDAAAADAATLVIDVQAPGHAIPTLEDDESYELEVGEQRATLRAAQTVGALRGLETLQQLLEGDRQGWYLPAVRIADRPRFPWRGLLIDVARHFMPVEVIKRNLDGMAGVKLNVLHWHLTEDQGFRVESRRYPRLHGLGSDGLYYTQEQIRDVVAYAAQRGIRVVPEFDLPGHATSWLVGHPELGSAPGPYAIVRTWGIYDGTLDPTREEVYKFLDRFFGEMAGLFPDAFVHIGGDENNGKHWNANPAIKAFMAKRGFADQHALQAYFNQRMLGILQAHGKRMVGWDEILHPALPKDIVVQSWRGQKSLGEAARQGYLGILSHGYYIDLAQPTARHYLVDPLPADLGLSDDEARRVLGGEACMWAEHVGPDTIDSRIWPRLAAIAERFWSPREVRDVADMYRRLDRTSTWLEQFGLTHEKNVGMLARQLANGGDAATVQTLIAVVEPVEGYKRSQEFKKEMGTAPTQQTPLTRLVDAAWPDSRERYRVETLVTRLLADAPAFDRGRSELQAIFARWQQAAASLPPLIDGAPALHEARPLVERLRTTADAGLAVLAWLGQGRAPDQAWTDATLKQLTRAAEPAAQVELAVVEPVTRLVSAAGNR
jgi:hexosaminidase